MWQGQQLVLDSGRQYRRACAEHRRSATDGAASFLGRAFGGGSKSASGRTPPVNQEATGQAAQQLRQAADERVGAALHPARHRSPVPGREIRHAEFCRHQQPQEK